MNSNSLYKVGLIIMIIINGFLIYFLIQNHPKGPMHARGMERTDLKEKISKQLNLSQTQKEQYFQLAREHQEKMVKMDRQQKELIKSYFSFLIEPSPNAETQKQVLAQLSNLESQKINITFEHFENLKALCNHEQKAQFGLVMGDIMNVLIREEKKLPPPPRDR